MLLRSTVKAQEWHPSDALFSFLDGCFSRLSKKAVKYYQELLQQIAMIHQHTEYSSAYWGGELLMVVIEQWPFVQGAATPLDLENISRWLLRFLTVLKHNGGDDGLLGCVRDQVKSITANEKCSNLFSESAESSLGNSLSSERTQADIQSSPLPTARVSGIAKNEDAEIVAWRPPGPPAVEDEDHPGLGKWKQLDIEEAVVEGAIGDLMLCLCSKYGHIRKQALMELRIWMRKLQVSSACTMAHDVTEVSRRLNTAKENRCTFLRVKFWKQAIVSRQTRHCHTLQVKRQPNSAWSCRIHCTVCTARSTSFSTRLRHGTPNRWRRTGWTRF